MSIAPSPIKLSVPDSVAADPAALELLRFWWSRGEPVMTVMPGFNDPTDFGRMLAVAARNIAHGYQQSRGMDEEESYKKIMTGLSEALAGPGYKTVTEPQKSSEA